jgi:hypothetical protein
MFVQTVRICITLTRRNILLSSQLVSLSYFYILVKTLSHTRLLYSVSLDPQTIQVGKDTSFGVIFQDNSQNILSEVSYSFKVTDSSGKVGKTSLTLRSKTQIMLSDLKVAIGPAFVIM